MRKSKKQGFSLVEVVLALAVVAFAFVAILGVIPAGMNSFRQAVNISVCSQIGQKVIGDCFQADYDTLMTPPTGSTDSTVPFLMNYRYFDEEGNEIITQGTTTQSPLNAIYLVITRVVPDIIMPGASATTTVPNPPLSATITVQVVFDPSGYQPSSSTDFASNLMLNSTTGAQTSAQKIPAANVYTYYAHIARN